MTDDNIPDNVFKLIEGEGGKGKTEEEFQEMLSDPIFVANLKLSFWMKDAAAEIGAVYGFAQGTAIPVTLMLRYLVGMSQAMAGMSDLTVEDYIEQFKETLDQYVEEGGVGMNIIYTGEDEGE